MKSVRIEADWEPKSQYTASKKDIPGKQARMGSRVWKNPRVSVQKVSVPEPGDGEVLVKVKACGICGSDIHITETNESGYMSYPGLTGFPVTLGHELSGIIEKVGKNTFNKETGEPYSGGEYVCSEEMLWCGKCKPCIEGYPNYCENLNEIGFNKDGGFAEYVVLPDKALWSLDVLRGIYADDDVFLIGSLIEPVSVAYHAITNILGGIKPGDVCVVCGGGPIGLAACGLLKRAGAAQVILSEPSDKRKKIGLQLGADKVINPYKEDFSEQVLQFTHEKGADIYIETSGKQKEVWKQIEQCIWEGKIVGSKVCILSRADERMDISAEVLQIKRVGVFGSYGHTGHSNFYNTIQCIAHGMNVLPMITDVIGLEQVPDYLISMREDKHNCKVSVLM